MNETVQVRLDGEPLGIRFDCLLCGKHFELEEDRTGVYHRPWMFHVAHKEDGHGGFMVWLHDRGHKDLGLLLLWYFAFPRDAEFLNAIIPLWEEYKREHGRVREKLA